jgi:hypothetical protein
VIVEWLLDVLFGMIGWIDELLPSFDDANGVVLTVGTFIGPLLVGVASLGVWIPWATVTICLNIVLAFYLGGAVLKFMLRALAVVRGGTG